MEIIEQIQTGPRTTWQQLAVWMAKNGYSDLEQSTVMTAQRLARERQQERPGAISAERSVSISFSMMMAAAAD